MAIDEERGCGLKAGLHGLGIPGIEADQDEALPGRMVALRILADAMQEGFLELENVLDVHVRDVRLDRGECRVDKNDILEVIRARRRDGSALIDFFRIEEVKHRQVLDMEDLVHTFEAKPALAVEEVGNVGLFESGLLGEAESGKFPFFDALPEDFTKILLQYFELHGRSIALSYDSRVTAGREWRRGRKYSREPGIFQCTKKQESQISTQAKNILLKWNSVSAWKQ